MNVHDLNVLYELYIFLFPQTWGNCKIPKYFQVSLSGNLAHTHKDTNFGLALKDQTFF